MSRSSDRARLIRLLYAVAPRSERSITARGEHEVLVDKRGRPTYVRLESLSDAQLGAMHRRYYAS